MGVVWFLCALCALPDSARGQEVTKPLGPSLPRTQVNRKDVLVRAARTAVDRRDWPAALARFREALELDAKDMELRKEFAGVLFQAGEVQNALEEYDRILEAKPNRKDIQDAVVEVCMAIRDFDGTLQRLLKYHPGREKERRFRLRLARAYVWTHQSARGVPIFAALVKDDADDQAVFSEYLSALLDANQWDDFATESQRYRKKWPDDKKITLNLVDVLRRQDRIPEALKVLEGLVRDPKAAPDGAWLRLADLRLGCGREPAEVRRMLENAAKGRKAPMIRARVALLYGYDGAFHHAFDSLKQAEQEGAKPELMEATAAELFSLGLMHRTAFEQFNGHWERGWKTVRVLKGIATAALPLYRDDKAKTALRRALILFPDDRDATHRYVLLLEERGETRAGLDVINSVLAKIPDNPTARLLRGRLMKSMGRTGEAAKDFDFVGAHIIEKGTTGVVETGILMRQYLDLTPPDVWRKVCAQRPEDTTARAHLAAALYRDGLLKEAVKEFAAVVKAQPDRPAYRLGLIEALEAEGIAADPQKRQRVEAELDALADTSRLRRPELARLAEFLVQLEHWEAVVRVTAEMLRRQPDDAHGTALHAGALMALGRTGEADAAIARYLAMGPANLPAQFRLWTRLGSIGRGGEKDTAFRAAITRLELLAQQFSKNPDILYAAGWLAATHRDFASARRFLDAVLDRIPDDAEALLWRARLESWDENYDESLDYYARYEKANPGDRQLCLERARVLGWALNYDESLEEYTRGIRGLGAADPVPEGGDEWARALYLEREAKRENWNQRERHAIEYYDQLLELRPEDPEIIFDRGQMATRLGFSRPAEGFYERALFLAPGHTQAADALDYERTRRRARIIERYDFRKEKGFSNLFEITEHLWTTTVWSPELSLGWLGDMWWFGLESQIAFYEFEDFPDPVGLRGRVLARKRFYNGLQLDFWLRESRYSRPVHSTTNLALEARYKAFDCLETLIGYDRQDVIENYRTIANETQRNRFRLGLAGDVTDRLRIETEGAYLYYEDDNNAIRAKGNISYKLLKYPRVLKLAYGVEYWDYEKQDRVYFSPHEFVQHGPSLHWRHYLNKEHYAGANELYYGIKVPLMFDNNGDTYAGVGLEFLWDITRKWQLAASFDGTWSNPYTGYFGTVWLRYRF